MIAEKVKNKIFKLYSGINNLHNSKQSSWRALCIANKVSSTEENMIKEK